MLYQHISAAAACNFHSIVSGCLRRTSPSTVSRMWGCFCFTEGANTHRGSLTGQMTSSFSDRGVIISSRPLPPPLSSSFTPLTEAKIPPTAFPPHVACNRLQIDGSPVMQGYKKNSAGLAPINSSTNVKLHATITAHPPTHPPPADSLWGREDLFLPVPRRWEGSGDSVAGAGRAHTHIHTQTEGDLLCLEVLFLLLAQRCNQSDAQSLHTATADCLQLDNILFTCNLPDDTHGDSLFGS